MSTTALVFQAGLYGDRMLEDLEVLVDVLTAASTQLAAGTNGTHVPLLPDHREMLRERIAHRSVPTKLCEAARHILPGGGVTDRFGEQWCDYYKSVSWNLPGAGAFVFGFVKGLLQLELPIAPSSGANSDALGAHVTVYGTAVSTGATGVLVPLPSWARPRWPRAIAAVHVDGLRIGGEPYALACDTMGSAVGASRRVLNCSLHLLNS